MSYNRPFPRRRRIRLRDRYEGFGFGIFFAIVMIVAIINLGRVAHQWSECNEAGGKMVQGLSTTGYVCVEGR